LLKPTLRPPLANVTGALTAAAAARQRHLCSQKTCSRLEKLPDLKTVFRLGYVLVDLWLSSYAAPPESVTLDIDDMLDVVYAISSCSSSAPTTT
jgi:hypothetical protein